MKKITKECRELLNTEPKEYLTDNGEFTLVYENYSITIVDLH